MGYGSWNLQHALNDLALLARARNVARRCGGIDFQHHWRWVMGFHGDPWAWSSFPSAISLPIPWKRWSRRWALRWVDYGSRLRQKHAGSSMAMIRLKPTSILVCGGTIDSGCHNGKKLDVVRAFEAWGSKVAGTMTERQIPKGGGKNPVRCWCLWYTYTANTMASAIWSIGDDTAL